MRTRNEKTREGRSKQGERRKIKNKLTKRRMRNENDKEGAGGWRGNNGEGRCDNFTSTSIFQHPSGKKVWRAVL